MQHNTVAATVLCCNKLIFFLVIERKQPNTVLFSKVGDNIEDFINPNEFFYLQLYLDSPLYIKFNISINKNSNIGMQINN